MYIIMMVGLLSPYSISLLYIQYIVPVIISINLMNVNLYITRSLNNLDALINVVVVDHDEQW